MPFKKGQSGNPGGRPKENAEVKELARAHGPKAIAKLAELLDGDDPRVAVSAAQALLDRGYGKPHQSMDIAVDDVTAHNKDELRTKATLLGMNPETLFDEPSDSPTAH